MYLCVLFLFGYVVFVGDWCEYYVEYWLVMVDQCNVYCEFVVVFDEFMGVVEWVDQLVVLLVVVYVLVVGDCFFGDYWQYFGQCGEICGDYCLCSEIGGGEW